MALPASRGNRKIPSPFKRPSIEISRHGRQWREAVPVTDIEVGDTVPGVGTVTDKARMENGDVVLRGPLEAAIIPADRLIKAFVKIS